MIRTIVGFSALMTALAGCAATPPPAAPSMHHGPAAAGKPVVTPIVRTATTISGQPLRLPQGAAEMVAASVDIPAGGRVMLHRHPWSRFVYVESGRIAVRNRDTGTTTEAAAGQALAEVVNQWHEADALDGAPARLVVIDVVPPGVVNVEMPPK